MIVFHVLTQNNYSEINNFKNKQLVCGPPKKHLKIELKCLMRIFA